jgi:hypothetical protein
MWEGIAIVALLALLGGIIWLLIRLLTETQSEDRSYSDKDSGWYNDAG